MSQADREYFAQRDACPTCGFLLTDCGCPIPDFLDLAETKTNQIAVKCNKAKIGVFERGDDGYYYFWPEKDRVRHWSRELLAALASALERLNKN